MAPNNLAAEKFYKTTEELKSPEEAVIQGKIPKWLTGWFLRTGPGVFDLGDFTVNHWFDGYAILSKFHIKDGRVKFEKKYLQSDAYKRAKAAGKPCICEYGTKAYSDPSRGFMSKLFNSIVPELSDNANVSIFPVGQNIFVTGETCFFYDLNLNNLNAGSKYDTNKVFGLHLASAHPLTDEAGNTYNIGASFAPSMKYCFVKIPAPSGTKDPKEVLKKAKIIASVPSRWNRNLLSYNHSFGLTKNYIVFIEQPYMISLTKILGAVLTKGQAFREWVEWKPEHTNRFYIIDKESGKVVSNTEFYSADPFFFVHFINCHEECGQVVVTISSYADPSVLDTQYMDKLRTGAPDSDETRAAGHQYVVPIDVDLQETSEEVNLVRVPFSSATAMRRGNKIVLQPEILTEKGLEFPTINKRFVGRQHRFYYASGLTSMGAYKNSVCKIDFIDKKLLKWTTGDMGIIGEPVFVPNPDGDYSQMDQEDDGVLVCPVTDYRPDAKDLMVFLDPKTMTELGRAEFKTQVPPSIHGIFVPSY